MDLFLLPEKISCLEKELGDPHRFGRRRGEGQPTCLRSTVAIWYCLDPKRLARNLCRAAARGRSDPHDGQRENGEGTSTCRVHEHKRSSFRLLLALDGGVEI